MYSHDPSVPAAVLFDLDGTLIDSEPVWGTAMRRIAANRGTSVSDDMLRRISGVDAGEAMALVHLEYGWPAGQVATDLALIQQYVRDSFLGGVSWLPGAREVLAEVRAHEIPTGLVTSTYRSLVGVILSVLGDEWFDVVVCGDDVGRPKPDPLPYLSAMAKLGVSPGRWCVAVEDSTRGVTSAVNAGCLAIQVNPREAASSACLRVHDLTEINISLLRQVVERSTAVVQCFPV